MGLSVLLIREALRRELPVAAGMVFLNLAMVFALQPIAARPDKSMALHWLEQTLTSGGAAAFALAAHLLLRHITTGAAAQEPEAHPAGT
ncbi:hypothetical protein HC928_20730 [bacterium]|nr:hypothetical protein [bacterium]